MTHTLILYVYHYMPEPAKRLPSKSFKLHKTNQIAASGACVLVRDISFIWMKCTSHQLEHKATEVPKGIKVYGRKTAN